MESSFSIALGISGMPESGTEMISGGLYALNVRTSSARFPLLSSTLQSALEAGLKCTIVTTSVPEELLQRLETPGGFLSSELLADDRLAVFSMQDEFSKKIFRYGADRLIQELEDFAVPEGSYLLFEQADDLLSLHDVGLALQQIKILAKWFKKRRMTGLMAFSRSNEQKLETLNNLMDHLTGIARLGGDRDGLELTFLYWRSGPGVMAAENFRLYTANNGLYAVSRRKTERVEETSSIAANDSTPARNATLLNRDQDEGASAPTMTSRPATTEALSPPQMSMIESAESRKMSANLQITSNSTSQDIDHHYFYVDAELEVLKAATPGTWHIVKAMAHVLQAAHDKPAAMIFLSFDGAANVIELARTVHSLRKTLGLGTQILVREKLGAVSSDQKQLLLHCGANVVISKDIALEHYPKFLNSLRNQRYSRSFEPDFEAILAALPAADAGADLPPTVQAPSYSYRDAKGAQSEPMAHRAIAKAKRSSLVS
jgi:hypothetical protein